MKNTILKVSALLVLIAVQPTVANANITVLGGINSAKPSTDAATTMKAANALSLGVLFNKHFGLMFGLETGVFFNKEKFTSTTAAQVVELQTKRLHIPLVIRFSPIKFLSVGAGGYFENGIGDVDYSVPAIPFSATQSYADSNIKKSDVGLDFDLRIRIPLAPMVGFVLDGRYQLGLTERAIDTTGGTSYKTRSMQYLAGFNFGM